MSDPIPPFVPPGGSGQEPFRPPQADPAPPPPTVVPPPPFPAAGPATPPAVPPPPPVAPPSVAPQYAYPAPPRSPRRGRTIGIVVACSAAAVLLVAATVWGAFAIVRSAHPLAGAPSSPAPSSAPHADGVTSSSSPDQPLHCGSDCFGNLFLLPGDTVPPPTAVKALKLPKTVDSLGDYSSSAADYEYDQTESLWKESTITPVSCFFTYFQSPVVARLGQRPSTDSTTIEYSGTYADKDEVNVLTQSVRIFADSDDAEAHMHQLEDAISQCPGYRVTDDSGSLDVALRPAEPFSDFPASESAVGWVETSFGNRYDTIDVQRGNLVVRTTLRTSDLRITEQQFRAFVADDAWQIAAIKTPGVTPTT